MSSSERRENGSSVVEVGDELKLLRQTLQLLRGSASECTLRRSCVGCYFVGDCYTCKVRQLVMEIEELLRKVK